MLHVRLPGEGRHLVNDRVRLGTGNRLADGRSIESIESERLRASPAKGIDIRRFSCCGSHLMTVLDEGREQTAADGAG
jgi:hypothetical protein